MYIRQLYKYCHPVRRCFLQLVQTQTVLNSSLPLSKLLGWMENMVCVYFAVSSAHHLAYCRLQQLAKICLVNFLCLKVVFGKVIEGMDVVKVRLLTCMLSTITDIYICFDYASAVLQAVEKVGSETGKPSALVRVRTGIL